MKHPTGVDWWLLSLLGGLVGFGLASGIFLLVAGGDTVLALTGIGLALLVMTVALPTRYAITDQELRVRAGLFLWKIPIAAIDEAHLTRNPLFAPAWSFKRVQVTYRKPKDKEGFVLISPKDREAFLNDLAGQDSELQLRSERVFRSKQDSDGNGETS